MKRFSSPAEAVLFARIFAFAAAVPILVRFKLARLAALLKPRDGRRSADAAEIEMIVRNVERAIHFGRPLVRRECLTRAVTLFYFLRRAGDDVTLCFGVGRVGEAFEGHSWLMKDGEPYLEQRDPRATFTEMYRIPEAASPADD